MEKVNLDTFMIPFHYIMEVKKGLLLILKNGGKMLLENYFYRFKDIKKIDDLFYIKISHHYYKYMVIEIFKIKIDFKVENFKSKYYEINDNILCIKQGYSWDGNLGPLINMSSTMIASLIHDAMYQAIREGASIKKNEADMICYNLMLQKSSSYIGKLRAKTFFLALKLFGYSS